ncbi:hypothetical protein JCM11641_000671 [Rhodosporidiobolus odoratus]
MLGPSLVLDTLSASETSLLLARIDNWALAFSVDEVFYLFDKAYSDDQARGGWLRNIDYRGLLLELLLVRGLGDQHEAVQLTSATKRELCSWLGAQFSETLALFEFVFLRHYVTARRYFEGKGHSWEEFLSFTGIRAKHTLGYPNENGSLAFGRNDKPMVTVTDFLCVSHHAGMMCVFFPARLRPTDAN